MKLTRMIFILCGGLAVMLAVVVPRAESTRLHFERAAFEGRALSLWQQLREYELELARLRNPDAVLKRVWDMRAGQAGGSPVSALNTERP